MPPSHNYTAGRFLLEIDGKAAGFLDSVDGGEAFADPVSEDPPVNGVVRKHPGPVRYAPIVITCGTGMTSSFYEWIAKVADGTQTPRNGSVVFMDYTGRELFRLDFDQSLATEIVFPAADAASKLGAFLAVTIQPRTTRRRKDKAGTAHAGVFASSTKKMIAGHYRFDVDQLTTTKVARVEPIVVKQALTNDPAPTLAGPVDVSAVVFSLPASDSGPVYTWHEDFVIDGNHDEQQERTGVLRFLDQSHQNDLFKIKLGHLGVLRVAPERHQANAQVIARSRVELYCEELRFSATAVTAGAPASGKGGGGGGTAAPGGNGTGQPVSSPTDISLAEAVLVATSAGGRALSSGQAEAVVGRLLATRAGTAPEFSEEPRRARGQALGGAWASGRAALDELFEVAALDGSPWSAIALPEGHSLISTLGELGVLPSGERGPLELERDSFVEGLVGAIAAVHGQLAPALADQAGDLDATSALKLQMAMDRMNKLLELLSNVLKKMSETQSSIIQNLK